MAEIDLILGARNGTELRHPWKSGIAANVEICAPCLRAFVAKESPQNLSALSQFQDYLLYR